MNLSNTQRVVKLANNLLSNPTLIPKYISHNFLSKKLPVDLNLPWWSYTSVDFVDSIVEGKRIFEYGTGGSTIRFSRKAKSITSVEDDENWARLVMDRLRRNNIDNVEIKIKPFDFKSESSKFCDSEYLKSVDEGEYDIVIIDGQDWTFKERIKCFRYVEPRMKEGQYIVVDDFWRYNDLLQSNRAKEVTVFESVGACRIGVTSTAVFSY